MKDKLISPLSRKIPHYAGQSLNERIQNSFDEELIPWLLLPVIFISFAGVELVQQITNTRSDPIVLLILAFLSVVSSVLIIKKKIKRIKQNILGRDGEMTVGHLLERFQAVKYPELKTLCPKVGRGGIDMNCKIAQAIS